MWDDETTERFNYSYDVEWFKYYSSYQNYDHAYYRYLYDERVEVDLSQYTATFTYTAKERGPLTFKIQFTDNNNELGLRPETVQPVLTMEGVNYGAPDRVVKNANGTFYATWDDLPYYDARGYRNTDCVITLDGMQHYTTRDEVYLGASDHLEHEEQGNVFKATFDLLGYVHFGQATLQGRVNAAEGYEWPEEMTLNLVDKNGNVLVSKQAPYHLHDTYNYWFFNDYFAGVTKEFKDYHVEITGLPPYFEGTPSTSGTTEKSTYLTAYLYGYNPIVKIIWDDEENRYGLRPEALGYQVFDAEDRVDLIDNHFTINASSTNAATQTHTTMMGQKDYVVPKRSLEGEELSYQVLLDQIPAGYEVVYGTPVKGTYTSYGTHFNMSDFQNPSCYYDYTFPVTLKLKTTKIAAQVEWVDEDNKEGLRPADVNLTLLANGKPLDAGGTMVADDAGNWMVEWNAPYADENGDPIQYTVVQSYLPIHYTTTTQRQLEDGTPLFHFSNDLQEHWNYYLELCWDTSIPSEKYDRYEIVPTNGNQRSLVYNLTINVNAARYDVGQLQVRIPYALTNAPQPLDNNYARYVLPSQIGVPQKPLHNDQFAFNYWIDDKGTPNDPMDDDLVFENWRMIEDSLNQSIEVLYHVTPYQMCDTVVSEFVATGNGWNLLEEDPNGEPEVVVSNKITYGIDTGIRLSSVSHSAVSDYVLSDDEYYYIKYGFTQYASRNQNHIAEFTVDAEGGEVVELYWRGNHSNGTKLTPNENGVYRYPYTITPTSGNYCRVDFWVKYPRSDLETTEGKHEVRVDGQFICNNVHENDKVEPYDYNDVVSFDFAWEGQWKEYEYEFDYDGELFAFDKYHYTPHEDYRITKFENGTNLIDSYSVSVTVNGYELNPHVVEVADDALYMFGNRNDGTKTDIVRLTEEDYRMYVNSIVVTTTDIDRETGDTVKLDPFDVIIEGKRTNDGPWEYITTLRINNSGTSYAPKASFFEENYVAMRARAAEPANAYTKLSMNVGVEIYADSPVVQALLQEDLKTIELHNYSIHEIYLDDGEGNFESITHFETPTLLDSVGTTELNAGDHAANGYYYLRDKASCYGGRLVKGSNIRKYTQKVENDTINSKVDVQFNVIALEYVPRDEIPEVTASTHMDEGVFYDLLPTGYTYNEDKGIKVTGYSTSAPAAVVKVETVDNYKGTGRQLVKFYVKYTGPEDKNYGSCTYGYGSGFNITFWAAISWKELTYFPYGYNLVAFQEGDGGTGRVIANSYKDMGGPGVDYFEDALDANGELVFKDINGDGLTDRQDTLYAHSYVNPDFIGAYQIGIAKLVKANSGYYRLHDIADLGGPYSYKLSFSASDLGFTKDLVMFDVLEDAANTEGHSGETFWKGTFAGISTSMPESQGIAPVIYYSTRTDLDSNHFATSAEVPNAKDHLKDTDTWSTTPPEDLSLVTAVAIDLSTKTNGEPYIFEAKSATEVEIFMTAPEELPEAPLAYNRFSYSSIFSANTTFTAASKHNIGHRVTVELQDLKELSFIKTGQHIEEEEPFALTGVSFDLYRCSHMCDDGCLEGCVHTHSGTPGVQTSCWTNIPVQTQYSGTGGRVVFNGLSTGDYAIVETATRAGFELPENTWWTFHVDATYYGRVSDPVNAGSASNHISFVKDEETGEWTLTNKRQYREYRIRKQWTQDSGKLLQPNEVIVDLYRNDELYIEGISLSTNNNFYKNIGKLPYADPFGKYYTYRFVERPVEGYSNSISSNYQYGYYTVTVTNSRLGILDIIKEAVNGAEDDVFTFDVTLTNSSNEPVVAAMRLQTFAADGSSTITDVASNEEGVLTVSCKRGETLRILDIPLSTNYSITEQEKPGYTGVVTEGSATGKSSSTTIPSVTFTNTYAATGELTLEGQKTVNGAAPQQEEVFQFQLIANQQTLQTVENAGSQITFAPITYTIEDLEGSPYTYTVKESSTSGNGYTVDDTEYTVFVWLADNGDGTLQVTSKIMKDGEIASAIAFDNTYEAVGSYTPVATKTVNGIAAREDQLYSFSLASTGDAPQVSQVKTNAGGTITFDALSFSLADAGKTYTYVVKEETASAGNLVADSAEYTLSLSIEDLRNGTLGITPAIAKGTETVQAITFDNTLYSPLTIEKTVDGPEAEETFPFTIRLYEKDGAESQRTFAYEGSQTGTLQSGDVIRLGHGEQIVIPLLLPGMSYTVQEAPGVRYTATVNGTNSETVQGVCIEGGNTAAFTNVFKTTSITVVKEWQGAIAGDIELTLYANGIKVDPQPVYHQDGQNYSYINLPQYDAQNQRYVYSVKEKYMDGYVTIYQNVAPYQSEAESVYDGGTIINREVVSFRIRKIWEGIGDAEPPEIQLILLCNGKQYRKSTPDPDEKGNYVYHNLPKYANGELAVYTVMEKPMSGFETIYVGPDGQLSDAGLNGGRIFNKKIPDTSDYGMPGWWAFLCLAAVCGLGMMALRRRKEQ